MDEIIRLRDHQRPCEHGSLWPHALSTSKAKWWKGPDCPGGKELVFRSVGEGEWSQIDPPEEETDT